jgi:hypothetical protein
MSDDERPLKMTRVFRDQHGSFRYVSLPYITALAPEYDKQVERAKKIEMLRKRGESVYDYLS